jgi:hypothetical protein
LQDGYGKGGAEPCRHHGSRMSKDLPDARRPDRFKMQRDTTLGDVAKCSYRGSRIPYSRSFRQSVVRLIPSCSAARAWFQRCS